ncbi:thioredoxin [Alkalithermobacter paradoxus]|uniref:Thioredoxin n=1 Tax=Alkalithermobacter paradoxus TaxID=29349 RepID=A0A1V4ICK9_9FIRM|nr:thioredoxin [[Clostridium] thermoalcaliphilum]
MVKVITGNEFKSEVEDYSGVAVVDFFAEWCGPCKMLAPVLDNLNEEMKDEVKFLKVDIDREMALAQRFNITSVPTMLVFKNGKVVDTIMGFRPKEMIQSQIKSNL